ncbi:MAG: regulating kinase and related kinase [Thermoplasmata archaeon]|nr:regulating kinase and related kinase [Thermoplasmata archaeon]
MSPASEPGIPGGLGIPRPSESPESLQSLFGRGGKVGAEAEVAPTDWMGRATVAKRRLPKPYRHPELDARLRSERTRDEAALLLAARRAGIPVPVLYDADRAASVLVLEQVPGPTLRVALESDGDAVAAQRLGALGRAVGRLHDAGLTHGDLTTSNVLLPEPADAARLVLIDFGLGAFSEEPEPRGVDLHLVEEALAATDARHKALFAAFLDGYRAAARCAPASLQRLDDIRQRGRYH